MSGYGFTAAGTTYDNEDRLTGFSRAATSGPALLSQSWNLTSVGDWTSVTTNGTAQNRTHGPTHELLTAGGQNVATDVKGNITTLPVNLRPAGSTTAMNLNWDSDNKLRSADIDANGTADVNFQYDALGRRVARSGTGGSVVYVQMDQQTIADYPVGGAATTPTFRYVYASYIDEPVVRKGPTSTSTVHFYHRNHQYSVTAVTTSAGAIAERYAYTAYGLPAILDASASVLSSSAINNRYTYTGREWDTTLGLHHFRARWMSPSAGRFLGRDPIGFDGGAYGIYEYCHTKPLIYMDPTGEQILPFPAIPGHNTPPTPPIRITDPWQLIYGTGYGRWCGLFRAGQTGPPIDALDRACQKHDRCVAKVEDVCPYWFPCAAKLCSDAHDARVNGCAHDYPNDANTRNDCQTAAWLVEQWACAQGQNNPSQPPTSPPPPTFPKSRFPCFYETTEVSTPDGMVAINELEVGDYVFGYDITHRSIVKTKIVKILEHEKGPYTLNLLSVGGESLLVTDGHPIFDGDSWILSHEFLSRDFLSLPNPLQFSKIKVNRMTGKTQNSDRVFNLITESGNYLVTKSCLVVSGCVTDGESE
jgi:RHS repeat-associated protein